MTDRLPQMAQLSKIKHMRTRRAQVIAARAKHDADKLEKAESVMTNRVQSAIVQSETYLDTQLSALTATNGVASSLESISSNAAWLERRVGRLSLRGAALYVLKNKAVAVAREAQKNFARAQSKGDTFDDMVEELTSENHAKLNSREEEDIQDIFNTRRSHGSI